MKVDSRITRGLQAEEVGSMLSSSNEFRRRLKKVLTEELNSVIIAGEGVDLYKSPNALAEIADKNGYRRSLRMVLKLIGTEGTE